MICQNKRCHKEIPDKSKFCMFCGRQQDGRQRVQRANGEGSIFQLPDHRWKAEIVVAYEIDGMTGKQRKVRRTKIGRTRAELVEMMPAWKAQCLAEYHAAIAALKPVVPEPEETDMEPVPNLPTLADCWTRFCESHAYDKLGVSQKDKLRYAFNRLEPLHTRPIADITLDEMQDIIDQTAKTYYPAKDMRTVLSHSFNVAVRRGWAENNRTEYLEMPQQKSKERQPFTSADIAAMWADWQRNRNDMTGYTLTMIYTGLRTGVLRKVQIDNVHLDGQYLIGGGKTKAGTNRTIPIADNLVPVLAQLIGTRKTGDLVPMSETLFYKNYWDNIDRLNVTRLEPYCCRHTFFTLMAEAEVQPGIISKAGGHKDYQTTLHYTHTRLQPMLDAVNRIQPPSESGNKTDLEWEQSGD